MANEKLIANESMNLQATPDPITSPWIPDLPSNMGIVLIKANKAEASSNKILINNISWVVSPGICKLSGYTFVSGLGIILATAEKFKCDIQKVMRKDDEGFCAGSFTAGTTTVICKCKFKIVDAGQQHLKGE